MILAVALSPSGSWIVLTGRSACMVYLELIVAAGRRVGRECRAEGLAMHAPSGLPIGYHAWYVWLAILLCIWRRNDRFDGAVLTSLVGAVSSLMARF